MFPILMVAAARRDRRRRMLDNLWPAMMPLGNETQRTAVAVMSADQSVRSTERAERRTASETVTAVQQAAANGTLSDADLQALPNLARVVQANPGVRQAIDQTAADQLALQSSLQLALADEMVAAVQLAADKGKLSDADLQTLPNLAWVVQANPGVRQAIDQTVAGLADEAADVIGAALKVKPGDPVTQAQIVTLAPQLGAIFAVQERFENGNFKPPPDVVFPDGAGQAVAPRGGK